MWRNRRVLTKIVATVGTASADEETLRRIAEAGASVFRLNFSHGTLEGHSETLARIRVVEEKVGHPIGVLGDLSGPKIRVGQVQPGGVAVEAGDDVIFRRGSFAATGKVFSSTYAGLVEDLEAGHKVLIADGAIRMLVVEKRLDEALCRVTTGGVISSGKGINLPNSKLNLEAITEKDWMCLAWAIENDLDLIAMSFVRRAEDITRLRARMEQLCAQHGIRPLPIVAKIERPEALENIEEILTETDVIMVARGDLGVEMDLAAVPTIQKQLINRARARGVPCIVATQMLESMMESPSPTRAEASDVANAILDGADAVMLSGETAVGKFPALAVDTMSRIAEETENYERTLPCRPAEPRSGQQIGHWTGAITQGAWLTARTVQAKVVIASSLTGMTAVYLSQGNFRLPIVICSSDESTLRRITVLRCITPVRMRLPGSLDEFTRMIDEMLLHHGWVERGEPIVMLAGHPIGKSGATNSLAVHYVGDPTTGYRGDD